MAAWDNAPIVSAAGATPAWKSAPVVSRKVGFAEENLAGPSEIIASGIANIPHAAAHGVQDLYRRVTGGDTNAPDNKFVQAIHVPTGRGGEQLESDIGDMLTPSHEPTVEDQTQNIRDQALGKPNETVQNVMDHTGAVGKDVLGILPAAGVVKGAAGKIADTVVERNAAAEGPGFRNADDHPIARGIAGTTGKDALTIHNQQIGNTLANAEAGVPHGTELSYENLESGRAAPNEVYGRTAASLPVAPLSPKAAQMVNTAGSADRITTGTPDAVNKIASLRNELLAPGVAHSGEKVINEMRGLRQEGYANIASDDVSNQQLGHAQLDMARGLEQHVADTLPAGAPVSMEQLSQARTAIAKNHAVQAALKGSNIDMKALGRVQRADPDMLTGGLKDIADFANDNAPVSGVESGIYHKPGYLSDAGAALGGRGGVESILSPSFYADLTGAKAGARRILTGDTASAVQNARVRYPGRLGDEFDPIEPKAPQPPPGVTAGPMGTPPAPAGHPGDIPLADLLSHGVEQSPAAGLSVARGAPPVPTGMPFALNAEHEAGGLSLADEFAPAGRENNSDLAAVKSSRIPDKTIGKQRDPDKASPTPGNEAVDLPPRPGLSDDELSLADEFSPPARENNADHAGVRSQGVPDGTMTRAPKTRARGTVDTIDFPSGARSPGFVNNNASGESAASLEAQNRPKLNLEMVGPDGTGEPILKDVTQADQEPREGHLIVDRDTGKIIKSGNMKPNLARGLLNRWKAMRDEPTGTALGMEFEPGG